MPGGHVLARRFDVDGGIVEEDVRAKGFEEGPLGAPAQEQRLVDAHAPFTQGEDDALVCRGRAGRHQGGADGRVLAGKGRLQVVQRVEKAAEGAAGQGFAGMLGFVAVEGVQNQSSPVRATQ